VQANAADAGAQLMSIALLRRMALRQCSMCGRPAPPLQCVGRCRAGTLMFDDLTFSNMWLGAAARPRVHAGTAPPFAATARLHR